jgi:hypothetical protein
VNVRKLTIAEKPSRIGKTQVVNIVLILEKMIIMTRLSLPDVNSSITDYASITASRACTKWMYMIDIKPSIETDHEPWLVVREYRASTMERFDVESHCLCTRWSISHLEEQ